MNPEKFVHDIRLVVRDQAVRDMSTTLSSPPGRSPKKELVQASAWFNSLDENSRRQLEWIIGKSVDSAIFGFLSVLDGVRAIEGNRDGAQLVLECRSDSNVVCLNDESTGMSLHDLYNAT